LVVGFPFVAVTEEARAWNSDAPPSLGGSPVVLQLMVGDAEAALSSMFDQRRALRSRGLTTAWP
jgi:hypothetical protein